MNSPKSPKFKTSDDELSVQNHNILDQNMNSNSVRQSSSTSFYQDPVELDWNQTKSSMHTSFSDDDAEDDTIIISAWTQTRFQEILTWLLYSASLHKKVL